MEKKTFFYKNITNFIKKSLHISGNNSLLLSVSKFFSKPPHPNRSEVVKTDCATWLAIAKRQYNDFKKSSLLYMTVSYNNLYI